MKNINHLLTIVLLLGIWFNTSAQKVTMLYDINTDSSSISSYPEQFMEYNNQLFFVAYHPVYGSTIWFSDGKSQPEAIIPNGHYFDIIHNVIVCNDAIYFLAYEVNNINLYSYRPETGIELALNIVDSFPEFTFFSSISSFKGKLILFTYNEEDHDASIWSFDGKNELSKIALPEDAKFDRFAGSPVTTTKQIYFSVESNDTRSIFMYDGENVPVNLSSLYETDEFENARNLKTFGDTLFFMTLDRATHTQIIHYYDEVNAPETLMIDFHSPELATVFKNEMYILQDMQMWKYNFKGEGQLAFDLDMENYIYNKKIFPHSTDYLYFFSGDINNRELYRYDGSSEPEKLADLPYSLTETDEMFIFNNSLFLNADDYKHGDELYQFNLENKQGEFFDLNKGNSSSNISYLTLFNNKIYFSAAENSNYEYHLWEYNGTEAPTTVELNEENPITLPSNFKVFNNKLYFSAKHPNYGIELMEYDGINPPSLVADIREGGAWSAPAGFTEFNNQLYFSANHDTLGRELWMLNNENVPELVADIYAGEYGSEPDYFMVFNNKLYFSAYTNEYGIELWEYDGENAPRMVADMNKGGSSFSPRNLIVYDNKLWFYANDSLFNRCLWNYNGQDSPEQAFDLIVANNIFPSMAIYNNELFFVAGDSLTGNELYKYNGTGTPELLLDINPGAEGSDPANLTAVSGRLLFNAYDGIYGKEMWEYNGQITPFKISSTNADSTFLFPLNFVNFNCNVIFSAWNNYLGREMWTYSPEPIIYIEELTSCGSFVTGGGQVIENSGIYSHTFSDSFGCDSIVELLLTVIDVNTQVDQNNNILTALAKGASFQWVDCDNNNTPIDGATQAQFTASKNGNYAVEVTVGDCTQLSDCFSVTGVDFDQNSNDNAIMVYPNPSSGKVTLDAGPDFDNAYLKIIDISGRQIMQKNIENRLTEINLGTTAGIYFITVFKNGEHSVKKVTIE